MSYNRAQSNPLCIDQMVMEQWIRIQINGTSDPDNVFGSTLSKTTVPVRNAAGKFTLTFDQEVKKVLAVVPMIGINADNVDIYAQAEIPDNMESASAKTTIIRTKTGAVNTDPPDNAWIYVYVAVLLSGRTVGGQTV